MKSAAHQVSHPPTVRISLGKRAKYPVLERLEIGIGIYGGTGLASAPIRPQVSVRIISVRYLQFAH